MYQYNKLKFMKAHGYETYIIYAIPGKIIIKEIEDVAKIGYVDTLNTDPRILNRKEIHNKLSEMATFLGNVDSELIIECCNKTTSLWGEILAGKYHCFSYSLILDEKIGSVDSQMLDFFRFKREKNELKGLKNETYEMLFNGEKVPKDYQYCLPIAGNNVVCNVEYDSAVDLTSNYGLKLCSIGRLDKAYIPTLVEQVISFAKEKPDLSILFGMIGDSPNNMDKQAIIEKISSIPNIKLYLFGSVYPIPEKLLYEFDVFISSAGSARVSGDRGIPTITIDSRDFMAIGIYQYETENTVFRQGEPKVSISEKLNFLIENYEDIRSKLYIKPAVDFDAVFSKHLEYYKSHVNTGEYYDVLSMKLSKGKMLEKIVYSIFGRKKYDRIREIVFARIQR